MHRLFTSKYPTRYRAKALFRSLAKENTYGAFFCLAHSTERVVMVFCQGKIPPHIQTAANTKKNTPQK